MNRNNSAAGSIYVGIARLPGRAQFGEAVAVELEIEDDSKTIVVVDISLDLAGMKRMLARCLLGRHVCEAEAALQDIRAHYHSPMQDSLCAAVVHALEAAQRGGAAESQP